MEPNQNPTTCPLGHATIIEITAGDEIKSSWIGNKEIDCICEYICESCGIKFLSWKEVV